MALAPPVAAVKGADASLESVPVEVLVLEGINNKLGVLKRIAYGFVNADNFAARALLWCPPVPS
jgi:hypothetical protein